MTDLPVLTRDRLTLRAFAMSDAPMVAQFCSDRDIAANAATILEKIGMRHEGHLREHFQKRGRFEDLEMYGLLAREYGEKIKS